MLYSWLWLKIFSEPVRSVLCIVYHRFLAKSFSVKEENTYFWNNKVFFGCGVSEENADLIHFRFGKSILFAH